jgi:hypothetical protein
MEFAAALSECLQVRHPDRCWSDNSELRRSPKICRTIPAGNGLLLLVIKAESFSK